MSDIEIKLNNIKAFVNLNDNEKKFVIDMMIKNPKMNPRIAIQIATNTFEDAIDS